MDASQSPQRQHHKTHPRNNLQLLSLPNKPALANRALQLLQHLLVQRRRARNPELNLAPLCAHQLAKLLARTLQVAEPVVLSESLEEVLDGGALLAAGVDGGGLHEFGDDAGFVGGGEGRGGEDGGELGVGFEGGGEGGEGLGGGLEGGGLDGGGVLGANVR